ncbi:MAG: hypothetical protein JXR78_04470 [Victivallales bacterium]|nr:hypothetical protein [Victivallales bacterium]
MLRIVSSANAFLSQVLPAALNGARVLARTEIRTMHVEKVSNEKNAAYLKKYKPLVKSL